VTQRWIRIRPLVACVVFAALGIRSLAVGNDATGALALVLSAFWLPMASRVRRPAILSRRTGG
jgi:hypothetical protein